MKLWWLEQMVGRLENAANSGQHVARLRAVLFLDACGYSSAVRAAEFETLRAVRADVDLASLIIEGTGGAVIGLTGDGLYAVFESARDAVDAALNIQFELAKRDRSHVKGYRIGVHIGDSFEMDGQIIGDAVNVAARIEHLGSAGKVLASKSVRDAVHGRPDLHFRSIGKPLLKNIGDALEVFCVTREDHISRPTIRLQLHGAAEMRDEHDSIVSLDAEQVMLLTLLASTTGVQDPPWLADVVWDTLPRDNRGVALERTVASLNALFPHYEPVRRADGGLWLDRAIVEVIRQIDGQAPPGDFGQAPLGDLLEGFTEGTRAFNNWLLHERAKLRNQRYVCAESSAPAAHAQGTEVLAIQMRPNFVVGILPAIAENQQNKAIFVANLLVEMLSRSLSETEALEVHDYRNGAGGGGLMLPQGTAGIGPDIFLQCRATTCEDMIQISVTALRPEDCKVIWSQNVVAEQSDFMQLSSAGMTSFISYATDTLLSALLAGRHMRDPAAHHAAKTAISAVHHLLTMTGPGLEKLEADILAAYEIDPKPVYLAWLAYVTTFQVGERYGSWDAELEERARELSRRAVEAGPNNGTVLGLVTHVNSYVFRDFALADELMQSALEISPYRAMVWDSAALLYSYTGRRSEAMHAAETARKLGRHSPYRHLFDGACCVASMVEGKFAEAARHGENVMAVQPEFKTVMRYLAATYGHLGDHERGAHALARLKELEPDISVNCMREDRFPVPTKFTAQLLERGLTRIGLPKTS